MEQKTVESTYRRLLTQSQQELLAVSKRLVMLSDVRRYLLIACGACLVIALVWADIRVLALVAASIFAVVTALIHYDLSRILRRKYVTEAYVTMNRQGIARRKRDWSELPILEIDESVADLPIAVDLDLFGHGSLMQLICTAQTEEGIGQLSRWLTERSPSDEVAYRQSAARELAESLQWRQELQLRCATINDNWQRVTQLRRWAGEGSPVVLPRLVNWYSKAVILIIPAGLVVTAIYPSLGWTILATALLVNFALTVAYSGVVHSFLRGILVTPDSRSFDFLSSTFRHIGESPEMSKGCPKTISVCQEASRELRRLERVLALESIARNPLSMLYIFIPLQFVFLWDLQVYRMCHRWMQRAGKGVDAWFKSLGHVEALCSIASVRYEQPTWVFPQLSQPQELLFVAKDLGHPIIADAVRVTNDVSVGPPGKLLLITGSNMGGKSTLLRAIGLNAVLAQAGAPCCCRTLEMPPLRVMTSMRVSDSLSDSTSLFMAQLMQLKAITDQLQASSDGSDGAPALYLFDEILNGTNTTDRRLAVEHLLEYLLRCHAIGAMTTHDLEIATESRYRDRFDVFYLGHQLHGTSENPRLEFDYRLRSGIAPRGSATALIQLLGLPPSS